MEYDNRFSMLIAMIWVIFMFSAAIPMLYIAGALLCFTTYWTDKTLLLKSYKTPPRHGSSLAHKARSIIEWALVVHLFTGVYMLSNPDIFTSEEDENTAVVVLQGYAKFVTIGIKIVTGVDTARFEQVHTVFYTIGIGIFMIFFIIEKLTGFFSRVMGRLCCCCLYRDQEPEVFSNDIFREISSESQRKEYLETKQLVKKMNESIEKEPNSEFTQLRKYYKQRLAYKIKNMRYHLLCAMSLAKIKQESLKDTKTAFFKLEKVENQKAIAELFEQRMTGTFTYNVLDSPDYI